MTVAGGEGEILGRAAVLKWKHLQNQETWLCHLALANCLYALSLRSLISKMGQQELSHTAA